MEAKPLCNEEYITLGQLCERLSISTATGRNWLRLGKLEADLSSEGKPCFSKEYCAKKMNEIASADSDSLKQRRNKRYITGNALYSSYLPDGSLNAASIEAVVDELKPIECIDEALMRCILADCAAKLYISRKINIGSTMISELLDGFDDTETRRDYPELFEHPYIHEEAVDVLGFLYISMRSLASRKASGAYYTPTWVVRKLILNMFEKTDFTKHEFSEDKILDPCCGTGNFLLQLPQEIRPSQIYGFDIDPIAVIITRVNLQLKYKDADTSLLHRNIQKMDFLSVPEKEKFHYILGNPPWGGNISEDLFTIAAIGHLCPGGVLSFCLPESVLNVKSHENVRKMLRDNTKLQLVDYLGEVFGGVQCPSIILQTEAQNNTDITACNETDDSFGKSEYRIRVGTNSETHYVNGQRLYNESGFLFRISDEKYSILNKLLTLPESVTLKDKAQFGLGIVTGGNKRFISQDETYGEAILRGSDISKYCISENRYIMYHREMYQQTAPENIYRAPEKLVYRFIGDKLIFAYDNRQRLTLNSCNIIIPLIAGMNIKYIMAVLNSSVAQFIYNALSGGSVKVLRSILERIPIPRAGESEQKLVIDYVDKLLDNPGDKESFRCLDDRIGALFGLKPHEFELIR